MRNDVRTHFLQVPLETLKHLPVRLSSANRLSRPTQDATTPTPKGVSCRIPLKPS